MSSIGTGYDLSASQFSPDGRVFQVEYAAKAVEASGTVIGIRGKDGVVIAAEKMVQTKLHEDTASKRIWQIDENIGMTAAGLLADGRKLAEIARKEATDYRSENGITIPLKNLAGRVSMYMHAFTLYSNVRPYGVNVIFSSWDKDEGPQLYMAEPSGLNHGYFACAAGKATQAAKTEIEKIQFRDMPITKLVREAAKIIHTVHDKVKDKEFVLELSWVGEASNGQFCPVPAAVFKDANEYGKKAVEESDDEE